MSDIELARIIWDYAHLNHLLKKADLIMVMGSLDTRVAEHGSQLFLRGYAPYILMSGGLGRITQNEFKEPEAVIYSKIAISLGVPEEKILIESESSNTGENISFSKRLLQDSDIKHDSVIVVHKPYMERRAFATFKKIWPEPDILLSSQDISLEEYPTDTLPMDEVISVLTGDLQRTKDYPKKGFQIEQDIPNVVLLAYKELVKRGYTKHLIKED